LDVKEKTEEFLEIAAIASAATLAGAQAKRIKGQARGASCGGLSAVRSFYCWPGRNLQLFFCTFGEK
jgi:hypothetical protein